MLPTEMYSRLSGPNVPPLSGCHPDGRPMMYWVSFASPLLPGRRDDKPGDDPAERSGIHLLRLAVVVGDPRDQVRGRGRRVEGESQDLSVRRG